MNIKFNETDSGALLVALDGKFNMYTVPEFQERMAAHPPDRDFILHLGAVPHIDSSALGTIIRLQLTLEEKGRRLLLAAPSDGLMEIFQMTGTAQRFHIFPTEQEALAQVLS